MGDPEKVNVGPHGLNRWGDGDGELGVVRREEIKGCVGG